ncbi:MAG: hypothetical protein M3Y35_14555, partial [Actinomycetota bacterium]|nr:hypothetical protein [Actinomycetota bacterium]
MSAASSASGNYARAATAFAIPASDPQPTGILAAAGLVAGGAVPQIPAGSNILTVGSGGMFATLGAAIAASHDGDVIEVQAGTYVNDFATIDTKITIVGVGGMVNLVATVAPSNGKAILVVDTTVEIDNLSFTGAAVADGNGAGIRYESGNLVLNDDFFFANQDGMLAAPNATGTITINHCEFAGNGIGDGQTHNLYVNDVALLTIENSYFTAANVGHEIKSRASNTVIENNVIADGPTAMTSYSIDLPNGGVATIANNFIEKGPSAQNGTAIHFGGEGLPYAGSSLSVTGNTIVNDLNQGYATGVTNATPFIVSVANNTIVGLSPTQVAHGPYVATGNVDGSGNKIADSGSTAIVSGVTAKIFTDTLAHSVIMGSQMTAVEGGAGRLTVSAPIGHVTVVGGSGGLVFTDQIGSGGDTIETKAGSSNVLNGIGGKDAVLSAGTDVIRLVAGDPTIGVAGAAIINGASGDYGFAVTGSAMVTDQGSNHATVNQGGVLKLTESNFADVVENLGTVSVTATTPGFAASVAVTGGSAEIVTQTANDQLTGGFQITTAGGGGPGAKVTLSSGNNTVLSHGTDTITAGRGQDVVQVDGADSIHPGSGTLSVFGHGGSATVYGGTVASANVVFGGDNGQNINFVGGARSDILAVNLAFVSIAGGSGHLSISATAPVTVAGG